MKIADEVRMLEISTKVMGMLSTIYPTLILSNDSLILVDAGYPGQQPQIREAIEKEGLAFDKLNMIILTHHDIDHLGGLASILNVLPDNVQVLAHEEEKPYIQGEKNPIKVAQLEEKLNSLPNEMKVIYQKLKAGYENCKVNVDKILIDGEELPDCGGIKVIHTPGHTLGHICLYLKQSKILIAGDALSVEEGMLVKTKESTHFDLDLSNLSLKKLTEYDIETVVCYHGGLYNTNANERIRDLANG